MDGGELERELCTTSALTTSNVKFYSTHLCVSDWSSGGMKAEGSLRALSSSLSNTAYQKI